MRESEIVEIIKYVKKHKTETNQIEVKLANGGFPKKCYDTISSFSNSYGGIIIFGIDENNEFTESDVYDVNDLQKQITTLCTDSMEPKIRPEFLPFSYNGKKLLVCKINELPQNKKPCYYKNLGIIKGSYIRVGDSDDPMTEYEVYALQSYKDGIQEDLRPIKRARLEDLNTEKLTSYITKMRTLKKHLSKFEDKKILKLCGIIENEAGNIYPTLAGVLLFADYPQAFCQQLFVACSAFPGNEVGELGEMKQRFEDNERIEGTIEEMLEGTLSFIKRNMKKRIIISSDTGKREDFYEYPLDALREAVANALVHRDYSVYREATYIQIHIFKNRIEIQNPGSLYGSNKIEKLGTDNIMEVRNSTIIKLLEEFGTIIENRHTGIPTMKNAMKKYSLPAPRFEEIRGDFRVTFYNSNNSIHQGIHQGIYQGIHQGEEQIKNKKSYSFNEEDILSYIISPKTSKEIADNFGYSVKHFKNYYLRPLIKKGKILLTIPDKPSSENQRYYSNHNEINEK